MSSISQIIIYVPHTCIFSELVDPGCDFRSRIFARMISKIIPHSQLISSRSARTICDNNREECRQSPSRKRLRKNLSKASFVIEVHTFSPREGHWRKGQGPEPDIAILVVNNLGPSRVIYRALSGEFDVQMLQGSKQNDVQIEVKEKGGRGVLLELSQDLSAAQIRRIGLLLKQALGE